jgi:hypothetical protein
MCHQVVCLIQEKLEKVQITTTSISIIPEITEQVGCPRFLHVPYPLGYPLGTDDDFEHQKDVCLNALKLVEYN